MSKQPQEENGTTNGGSSSSNVNKEEEAVGICTTTKERFNVPLTYDCTDVFTHPQKWTEWPVIIELSLIFFYSLTFLFGLLPKWVRIILVVLFIIIMMVFLVLLGELHLLEIGL